MRIRGSQRIRSASGHYLSFLERSKLGFLRWDLLWFDFGSRREAKASEGLLGHLSSPKTQAKESEVKRKAIRERSKSPREATTVAEEQNFGSTGRSKLLQQEVVVDLILECICLSLGHGIRQLKDLKDKEEIYGFSPQDEGFWSWLATYILSHYSYDFGSFLMYCTLE